MRATIIRGLAGVFLIFGTTGLQTLMAAMKMNYEGTIASANSDDISGSGNFKNGYSGTVNMREDATGTMYEVREISQIEGEFKVGEKIKFTARSKNKDVLYFKNWDKNWRSKKVASNTAQIKQEASQYANSAEGKKNKKLCRNDLKEYDKQGTEILPLIAKAKEVQFTGDKTAERSIRKKLERGTIKMKKIQYQLIQHKCSRFEDVKSEMAEAQRRFNEKLAH